MSMHAAVVRSFEHPPLYETYESPEPAGPEEAVVDVLAVGLHPRVRSGASGQHYSNTGTLPMIPGIDGVGRLPDDEVIYFVTPEGAWGSMAQKAVVDMRLTVPLSKDVDLNKVAAAMNPAMSAWMALRRRVPLESGQEVLVLGATGNAGSMAVQLAKRLGAGRVIGAGRNAERLAALAATGADELVALTGDPAATAEALAKVAAEVDVVIDYLWGTPASVALMALLKARTDRSRAMDWIQIGAVAGPTIELPSVALRSSNLRLQGVGQGAVSRQSYVAELPSLVEEIRAGSIDIDVRAFPLRDIEAVWNSVEVPGVRTVLIP